ncbi:MAG: gliding motility lipoprotein GldD [Bacteroidales bacterium]|jgi:gliding motility-associated lipoprotein GldD|nr:gliding motility lipoprotein GldD [Bacteroidales bacterium]
MKKRINTPVFRLAVILPAIILLAAACRSNETPKPHAYFRMSFPEKEYQIYDAQCPFTFEFPVYGKIVPVENHSDEPCLFNISFPAYKGTIHLTYKEIKGDLDDFLEDDWTFVFKKIAQRADAVDMHHYSDSDRKVYATVYDIKGNAASPVQFFVTDSVRNFLRGSLYFAVQPNYDSLEPAIVFFRKDIIHIVESVKWNSGQIKN